MPGVCEKIKWNEYVEGREKKIEHRLTLTRGELKELIQDRGSVCII